MSQLKLFLKISEYDEKTHKSKLIDISDYPHLDNKNGGSWCRMDGKMAKHYKFFTVKDSGEIRYSWIPTDNEKSEIKEECKEYIKISKKSNKIRYIKIFGIQEKVINRPIRTDIRNIIKNQKCVSCGTKKDIEVDHKNGLYNDKRVLNLKTQVIDDFQPLCKHCNLEKREIIKKMKATGIRPSATEHPIFSIFNLKYIEGDENYNINNPNALVGVLWYDFIAFAKFIKSQFHQKNESNLN